MAIGVEKKEEQMYDNFVTVYVYYVTLFHFTLGKIPALSLA